MRDVLWIARTAWWFGAALGQMDSLHNHCALLLSLGHFSVSQLSFILPLYPLNHFYPVFFCPSRLCVCSPPIIFIPMWIEFGVLDIPLKVGSWKLFMGSLIILPVVGSHKAQCFCDGVWLWSEFSGQPQKPRKDSPKPVLWQQKVDDIAERSLALKELFLLQSFSLCVP